MTDKIAHPVVAAAYDPVTWIGERTILRRHREYLAADVTGRVLDLGAGTGAMFPYFAAATGEQSRVAVHAVDPDPHMMARARKRAAAVGLDVELHSARAEALPYPSESFDYVIAAMVFCTIPDVTTALKEVARVLKPDGEARFLEHVAAGGWQRRLQETIAPVWQQLAGGCHVTRDTEAVLKATSTIEVTELQRLRTGIPPVRPFIRGRVCPQ